MMPVTPPLADVLNSYMRHVVRDLYPDTAIHEGLEKAIRPCIVELHTPAREQERKRDGQQLVYLAFALVLLLELYYI
jgi:hypothetical protein